MRPVRHRNQVGNVLVRNALVLMISTAGSAMLGMAFWAVAGRLFSPSEVGRASAEVASVTVTVLQAVAAATVVLRPDNPRTDRALVDGGVT